MNDKLIQEVIEIVADVAELTPQEVGAEALLEDLGIDSLGGLRIVAAVEKKYKIIIDEAAIGKIRTMPDILALIQQHTPDVN